MSKEQEFTKTTESDLRIEIDRKIKLSKSFLEFIKLAEEEQGHPIDSIESLSHFLKERFKLKSI